MSKSTRCCCAVALLAIVAASTSVRHDTTEECMVGHKCQDRTDTLIQTRSQAEKVHAQEADGGEYGKNEEDGDADDVDAGDRKGGGGAVCKDKAKARKCRKEKNQCASNKQVRQRCKKTCGVCKVCKDTNPRKCKNWANAGRCSKVTVEKKCPKSCGKCDSQGTKTTPAPEVACEDKSKTCAQWAARGRCSKVTVEKKCPKSCGKCDSQGTTTLAPEPTPTPEPEVACEDLSRKCANWAAQGKCIGFLNVRKNCRKTCGLCGTPEPEPESEPEPEPAYGSGSGSASGSGSGSGSGA